jgi:hypothetical protein
MKTHLQLLITTLCVVALLFTSAALAQEPDQRSQTSATATVAPRMNHRSLLGSGNSAAAGSYKANFQPKWQPENVISPEPSPRLVPF